MQSRAAGKAIKPLIFLFIIFNIISCAEIKTRKQIEKETEVQQPQADKSIQETVKDKQQEVVVPEEAPVEKPKVGLILGPGGIKTFAHTGVIKELEKARVPIDAIVGIEWGALVGGLYSQHGQVHEAEWTLYKMEKKDFYTKGFFEDKFEPRPINEFVKTLKSNFQTAKLEDYKLPFSCPSRSIWSGRVSMQTKGTSNKALKRCLAFPPFFKAEAPWMAAGFSLDSVKKYLTSQGISVVIFVNVLSYGDLFDREWSTKNMETALLWREMQTYAQENKDLVGFTIDVETRKFNIFDFENRKYLVYSGEKAGRKAGRKIVEKYGF